MSKVHIGNPWPLGSSITQNGVNFCVAAPNAISLELLIFSHPDATYPEEIITLESNHRSGDYWHVEVEGVGDGCCYSYHVFSQHTHQNNSLKSKKVLLDPCARGIGGWNIYKRDTSQENKTNLDNCLKAIVCERDEFDFKSHPRPRNPWHKSIIYELHVGGFTKSLNSSIDKSQRGTFLGLIHKIPYLKDIGITAIELLPVFAFDHSDSPVGLENYWGYSPLNWFTPHESFIDKNSELKARDQVRKLVSECHDNNIEVLIDVVYNHTTEGSSKGPVISWKGFDDSLYYYRNKKGDYLDVSGCGNSVAGNRPLVRKLIIESMRCWANELGIDGFRFDLGVALSRGEDLAPLPKPPLFEEIEADPSLSDLKLISEPWDCGGLYKLADFPANRFKTWNGRFRDDLRRFWKGDKDSAWNLKDRLRGSKELYKNENASRRSVNFITAHDGFTLNDLVSFSYKHNLANGEKNRDGENNNNSFNYGIEGPSTDLSLIKLRKRQQRNLLASLLLSPGIPMLLMGDEVGRSQGGNNNTWCQNNPLGWMIWDPKKCDLDLYKFVKKLVFIRQQLQEIFNPITYIDETNENCKKDPDALWIQWHGIKPNKPDWGHWSHTISYSINQGSKGSLMWIGLNAYNKAINFELPQSDSSWGKILDTTSFEQSDQLKPSKKDGPTTIKLENRSLVVCISKEYASKIKKPD